MSLHHLHQLHAAEDDDSVYYAAYVAKRGDDHYDIEIGRIDFHLSNSCIHMLMLLLPSMMMLYHVQGYPVGMAGKDI